MLDRQKLLNMSNEINIEKVKVKDDFVYIKEMTGTERDAYEQSLFRMNNNKPTMTMENARAKLLVKVICDKDGKRIFKDADINALGSLPAKVLDKLFSKAQSMNGISDDDIDELTKN
jgi:hypothetical protein